MLLKFNQPFLVNQILTLAMEKDLVSRIVVLADMYFACLWKSAMNW